MISFIERSSDSDSKQIMALMTQRAEVIEARLDLDLMVQCATEKKRTYITFKQKLDAALGID